MNLRSLSCKFGTFPLVEATFVSETKLQSISPQMINETDIFEIPLAVTNNGYHFSNAIISIGISSSQNRNISKHFYKNFNPTSLL